MKRILLLGDSIRMGYQEYVKKELEGLAEVVYPEENGRFSKYTLWGVNVWIRDEVGRPDIIHWNNGIWDIHREPPMTEPLTDKAEYEQNLRRCIQQFRHYTNDIIFATTTFASDQNREWKKEDIMEYNALAKHIMEEEHIPVNDLNALLTQEDICDDLLHLNETGYRKAARQTAEILKQYL